MSTSKLEALVVGAGGQLGKTLIATCPDGVECRALTRADLDVTDADAVHREVAILKPDVIINASAYTAVDKAETEQELARLANVEGPRNLAAAAQVCDARLIHVSTDFVFDGSQSVPYQPDAVTAPLGVYGLTKRQGEQAVLEVLNGRAVVVRTAWVYAAQGKNFMNTMLRLMRDKGAVRVVADQVGTPTCTHSLAEVLWRFSLNRESSGVYHWTDAGVASWYDFALAIAEGATAIGLLSILPSVTPIATHEFPTPVKRPSFSVLDKSTTHAVLQLPHVHWRQRLREVLAQLKTTGV